jgi:hypothetical protein
MVNVYFRGFRASPEWMLSQYTSGVVAGLHWTQLASYEDAPACQAGMLLYTAFNARDCILASTLGLTTARGLPLSVEMRKYYHFT